MCNGKSNRVPPIPSFNNKTNAPPTKEIITNTIKTKQYPNEPSNKTSTKKETAQQSTLHTPKESNSIQQYKSPTATTLMSESKKDGKTHSVSKVVWGAIGAGALLLGAIGVGAFLLASGEMSGDSDPETSDRDRKTMKAPGRPGERIYRDDFEGNPRAFFRASRNK